MLSNKALWVWAARNNFKLTLEGEFIVITCGNNQGKLDIMQYLSFENVIETILRTMYKEANDGDVLHSN